MGCQSREEAFPHKRNPASRQVLQACRNFFQKSRLHFTDCLLLFRKRSRSVFLLCCKRRHGYAKMNKKTVRPYTSKSSKIQSESEKNRPPNRQTAGLFFWWSVQLRCLLFIQAPWFFQMPRKRRPLPLRESRFLQAHERLQWCCRRGCKRRPLKLPDARLFLS